MCFDNLNRKVTLPLVTALAVLASMPPCFAAEDAKAQEADCPAAFRSYSSGGTPLLDLLLNPATKAVVERDLPGFLAKLPPILAKPTPPPWRTS